MLYSLSQLLFQVIPGATLMKYVTFRTFCALFMAFIVSVAVTPWLINKLHKLQKEGQPIRECGPETHLKKKGTPTMGGLVIFGATLLSTLLFADLSNQYVWAVTLLSIVFFFIGFVDDYQKVKKYNSDGINAKQKLIFQIIVALIFSCYIESIRSNEVYGILTFPFFKNATLNLGVFLPLFSTFVIVGASNAVNLTDGLDGLVSVPVILCAMCFGLISYLVGHVVFANYLQVYYIANASELCIICGALIGGGLGFLWYNAPPAAIFMGDTGSMYIGGIIGALSVIVKHEFVLAIIGGVFVAEAASVIIQVISYKKTGKRVFLMTPIHHHFEKKGWLETTVVVRFWIISALLTLVGLATLKIR